MGRVNVLFLKLEFVSLVEKITARVIIHTKRTRHGTFLTSKIKHPRQRERERCWCHRERRCGRTNPACQTFGKGVFLLPALYKNGVFHPHFSPLCSTHKTPSKAIVYIHTHSASFSFDSVAVYAALLGSMCKRTPTTGSV